jgi:alanine racemase
VKHTLSFSTNKTAPVSDEKMITSSDSCLKGFHSFIAISRSALRSNIETIRSKIGPETKLAIPVKSNAYGHGVREVVSAIDDLVDRYLIDDSRELFELRTMTKNPIELLGYVSPAELDVVVEAKGVLSLFDEDHARSCLSWALERGEVLKAFLAIDLQFGREGVSPADAPVLIQHLRQSKGIELLGIYGHFSCADEDPDLSISLAQQKLLSSVIEAAQCQDLECHLFASSGLWRFNTLNPYQRVIRPGLSVYGMWPSPFVKAHAEQQGYHLKPCLSWHSTLAQVKQIPADFPIGYGGTYRSKRPMMLGLIPQGYGDGLPRTYQKGGYVLIDGIRCPILGRISMNMAVVDLSELGIPSSGADVVLIGSQGSEMITPEDHAVITDTIPYEVTTRISPILPRVLVH